MNEKDVSCKKEKGVENHKEIEMGYYSEEKLTQEDRFENYEVKKDMFQFVPINNSGVGGDIKNFKIDIISDLNKVTVDTLRLASVGSYTSSGISSSESTSSIYLVGKKELGYTLKRKPLAKKKNFEIKNGGESKGKVEIDPHNKTDLGFRNEQFYKEFENLAEMKKGNELLMKAQR
ncbi:hypothetical protein AYI70_g2635 [Smittium culicis]|uniref:Uncharacterized protein n=1 Tax=Smittium culicis TaxID=133412 RepID=A0A1R1Y7G0_9FUNG|nr:hypothetical protein AYI70_g11689 [Smittium culicis]OMJ22810.1 hypothetical protein AYI70_g2635 [Smittium culicis]